MLDSRVVLAARVLDTSAGGARVLISDGAPRAEELPLGTPISVRFKLRGVEQALVASAQSGNVRTTPLGLELGLRFVDRARFHGQLTPRLWERFNRRRRGRLRCTEASLVADVRAGRASWRVPVNDLSELGLGLQAPFELAVELAPIELVEVTLALPGEERPVGLACGIVHRTEFGHGVRHGLAIEERYAGGEQGERTRLAVYLTREAFRRRAQG